MRPREPPDEPGRGIDGADLGGMALVRRYAEFVVHGAQSAGPSPQAFRIHVPEIDGYPG